MDRLEDETNDKKTYKKKFLTIHEQDNESSGHTTEMGKSGSNQLTSPNSSSIRTGDKMSYPIYSP